MPLLVVFAIPLAYALYRAGGVVAADAYLVGAATGVLGLLAAGAQRRPGGPPPLPRLLRWAVVLVPVYIAAQTIPLPLSLVAVLSPARAAIDRPVASLLGAGGWVPLSVVPGATFLHAVEAATCVLIFLAVRQTAWRLRERAWLAVLPLVVLGAIEALWGLWQARSGNPARLPSGTYVNHNHFAGLLEMILPFAVLYPLAYARGLVPRPIAVAVGASCLSIAAAGLMLAAILRSLSRMGLLAALAALAICGAGIFLSRTGLRGVTGARRVGLVLAAGLVLVAGAFFFLPPDELVARFATSDIRAEIWRESLPLARDYWLLGCGSGGYESVFMQYKQADPMYRIDYAHNDYLQRFVELGVAGAVLAGCLMLGVLAEARRGLASASPPARAVALACIAGMAAILLHSLVDFNLYIPANAMVLAWISGIAVATPASLKGRN